MTVRRPLGDVDPSRLLSHFEGGPRGFWARADRWIVHGGVAHSFRIEPGSSVDDGGEGRSGEARFARLRDDARDLVGLAPAAVDDPPEAATDLRCYGGFSFRDDETRDAAWGGFPSGLFHVPRVEVRGGVGRPTTLRLRAPVGVGEDETTARERLVRLAAEEERRLRGEAPARVRPAEDHEAGAPRLRHRDETEQGRWEEVVREALQVIGTGSVAKVVLARTLDLAFDRQVDPVPVVMALWRQSRGTHAFLFEPEAGRCFLGAAPETIATLRDGVLHATAVAGSIRAGADGEERERLARQLLASRKDREEQRVVVEDMVRRLEPFGAPVRVQDEPHVLQLARIQHLETVLRARIAAHYHVLDIVGALHPTPAVCGSPRDAALELLLEEEPFERGWYSGPVGWFDSTGDGVFVPALRSAVVTGTRWRLFAGAGIVAGSDPAAEWEETRIKFEPVLGALEAVGVSP